MWHEWETRKVHAGFSWVGLRERDQFQVCGSVHLQTTILNKIPTRCTISLKVFKIYLLVHCSTCFGHHCAHHQEPPITAHAVSGHRVLLGPMLFPALFGY
jgi:hypothetical protein